VLILKLVICAKSEANCDFIDTINISSGYLDQNGNYRHQGNIYKKGMFANYNFEVEHFSEIKKVEPHVRGCVCELKTCLRLCCLENLDVESDCVKTETLSVPIKSGNSEIDLKSEEYAVIEGWPCENMYSLEPLEFEYDDWYFEVRTFLRFIYDSGKLSKGNFTINSSNFLKFLYF
jgi:G protein-coupled receptor Mth (Methuselah protein)